jgi:hypothetical protein
MNNLEHSVSCFTVSGVKMKQAIKRQIQWGTVVAPYWMSLAPWGRSFTRLSFSAVPLEFFKD